MSPVIVLISWIIRIYMWGLIAYAILSWFPNPQAMSIRQSLEKFYAPFLDPIRRVIGTMGAGGAQVDFSPLVLIVILIILERFLISLLVSI